MVGKSSWRIDGRGRVHRAGVWLPMLTGRDDAIEAASENEFTPLAVTTSQISLLTSRARIRGAIGRVLLGKAADEEPAFS